MMTCIKTSIIRGRFVFVLLAVCALTAVPAFGKYELGWNTINAGGGQSSSATYVMTGTIAQPDTDEMSADRYELIGGFWAGGSLCIVELSHYARFAEHWLDGPCNTGNHWCSGADLNQLDDVDEVDLWLFVNEWLCSCPYNWPLK